MASAADAVGYLDSSALMKLVVAEPESPALIASIRDLPVATSELALAELPRAVNRLVSGRRAREREGLLRTVQTVLERVALVPLERELLMRAGSFTEAYLRTLDAIHIASALALGDVIGAFVSYDERQLEAADVAGLPIVRPA